MGAKTTTSKIAQNHRDVCSVHHEKVVCCHSMSHIMSERIDFTVQPSTFGAASTMIVLIRASTGIADYSL